jgi:hypothetical protein
MALLTKWRCQLLKEKYGGKCNYPSSVLSIDKFKFSSLCWTELCALGKELKFFPDWFVNFQKKVLVMGESIFYWYYIWIVGKSLDSNFHRLFSLAIKRNKKASQMERWVDEE